MGASLCWLVGHSCGAQEKSFLLQKQCRSLGREVSSACPPFPLFRFASRSGLGACPPDCRGVARQWGSPDGFRALSPREQPPETVACDALPPFCIPVQEISQASPRQGLSLTFCVRAELPLLLPGLAVTLGLLLCAAGRRWKLSGETTSPEEDVSVPGFPAVDLMTFCKNRAAQKLT